MRKFKGKESSRGDITARADDAFGSANYAEYMVDVKKQPKFQKQRMMMVLLYLAVGLGLAIPLLLIFPFAGAIVPLLVWILWFFTWPYVSPAYYYTVDTSYFTILTVYGGKYEKDFVKVRISEAELIAPLNDEYTPHAHANADATRYEAVSSFSASDIYFMTFTDKDGKPAIVFFEATESMLKAMKYYNSKALVMTKTLR